MKHIIVLEPFKFAHHGYQVEEFAPSKEPVETTDECAELAIAEKWAKPAREAKAHATAPEHKAELSAPERKDE
jgi:hypothetical protein